MKQKTNSTVEIVGGLELRYFYTEYGYEGQEVERTHTIQEIKDGIIINLDFAEDDKLLGVEVVLEDGEVVLGIQKEDVIVEDNYCEECGCPISEQKHRLCLACEIASADENKKYADTMKKFLDKMKKLDAKAAKREDDGGVLDAQKMMEE